MTTPSPPTYDLAVVAHHEAGHAVASYLLRRRVVEVSIIPDLTDGTLGHCDHGSLSAALLDDLRAGLYAPRNVAVLRHLVISTLAGEEAETIYVEQHPGSVWRGSETDVGAVWDMLFTLRGRTFEPSAEVLAELAATWPADQPHDSVCWELSAAALQARHEARELLETPQNWAAVQAVAAALLARQRLSGAQFRRLLREHFARQH